MDTDSSIVGDPSFAGFGDWREEAYFAAKFNVHRGTWRRWATRVGLQHRKLGQKRFHRQADVAELMDTGVAPIRRRKMKTDK